MASVIRTTPQTTAEENEVAHAIEARWGVKCHRYGYLDSVDWWIEKDGRTVAFAEMKNRNHEAGTYPTVFLAHHKWLALHLSARTGVASLFVVRFTDGIRWVNVNEIDPRALEIAGRRDRPGMPNDIEPVIHVPIEKMKALSDA